MIYKRKQDYLQKYYSLKHALQLNCLKKRLHFRSSYENRFRIAEKCESDSEKLKFGSKPKEAEKAKARAVQTRGIAYKADEDYKSSVTSLETARATWVSEYKGIEAMLIVDLMHTLVYVSVLNNLAAFSVLACKKS